MESAAGSSIAGRSKGGFGRWNFPLTALGPRIGRRGERPDPPRYSFSDIGTLKALVRLRKQGLPAHRLRAMRAGLQECLRKAGWEGAWSELSLHPEGKRLAVCLDGLRMEPATGQLLFNYGTLAGETKVRALEPSARQGAALRADRQLRADRLFEAGLRYEASPESIPKAVRAYLRALELNPQATGALINLGTIYYNRRQFPEAEKCYRAAAALDPGCALVQFNLGNVCEETSEQGNALEHYQQAIHLDPYYADPHYNLALVYERLGKHGKALEQWRAYLKLDPHSSWAAHARRRIEAVPLRVLRSRSLPADA